MKIFKNPCNNIKNFLFKLSSLYAAFNIIGLCFSLVWINDILYVFQIINFHFLNSWCWLTIFLYIYIFYKINFKDHTNIGLFFRNSLIIEQYMLNNWLKIKIITKVVKILVKFWWIKLHISEYTLKKNFFWVSIKLI